MSPGDTITGEWEVLDVPADKPVSRLRTLVVRDDGITAVEGTATCYTVPLPASPACRPSDFPSVVRPA